MIPLGAAVYFLTMKLIRAFAQEDFDFLGRLLPEFLRPLVELLRRLFLGPRRNEAF